MFWNCRGYPWNKGLGLKDVAQGMDIILLPETWEHQAKHIPKIDGYLIKSIRPHSKGIIGHVGIACIYHESLDNSIKVCKYDDIHMDKGYFGKREVVYSCMLHSSQRLKLL